LILIIDNYDSFTYNLVDYFQQLGTKCHVVKNDDPYESYFHNNFDAVVISPGPGLPKNAGLLFKTLNYFHQKKPILGICLGHQAICEFFGGTILHAHLPMHGKISKIHCLKDPIFNNMPDYFNVVRYHSLIVNELPSQLELIAYTEEMENMAIRHKHLPIWGIQFHPEAALTEYGLDILSNWLTVTNPTN